MQQDPTTKLSEELRLRPFSQDWGIANADPGRIDEFLRFYESCTRSPSEHEALAELLLQSINEALEANILSEIQRERVVTFLRTHSREFPRQLPYWSALVPSAADPWPVLELLREAGVAA
jgi:hypothetical protein